MGSMVHYFLMIPDSMGKHGEHGNSLFSSLQIVRKKHGEHGNYLFSSLQIAWKSMESKVLHFL